MTLSRRRKFLDWSKNKPLSLLKQCRLLHVSRSGVYYTPKGMSDFNQSVAREIDAVFLACPFYGSRQMTRHLNNMGYKVGRDRVMHLMRIMGLSAIYQKPKTTVANPEHKKHPYLLRDVVIDHVDQVWSTDISYIPMRKGFLYLVAVIDWYSRKILSWRISNTMDVDFCIETLKEALAKYGKPEIFNSDQGSQFTSISYLKVLQDAGIQISMDGRGRCKDNIFMERFWRSLKYEEVYLKNYETGREARQGIGNYIAFYNQTRPHSSDLGLPPDQIYFSEREKARLSTLACVNDVSKPV